MTFAVPLGNFATLDLIFAAPPDVNELDSLTDQARTSLVAFASESSYLP